MNESQLGGKSLAGLPDKDTQIFPSGQLAGALSVFRTAEASAKSAAKKATCIALPHRQIMEKLKANIGSIDFRAKANLGEDEKLHTKHYVVVSIEEIIETAHRNNWSICRNNGFVYLYNGAYWTAINKEMLQSFFGECAERMKVPSIDAKHHLFRLQLEKQFEAVGYFPVPEPKGGEVLINLQNGTMSIVGGKETLRKPSPNDFIKYQLPYAYEAKANAPKWQQFLDRVQPDKCVQEILQEYVGYVFSDVLNLETALLLYGTGANGKSVFIDVISAMLGNDNVSFYSLESLTKPDSYTRANLANKLLNCANEISGKLQSDTFKQMASGQPIEARMIYKEPFIMERYAKLLFSCNELPREVEQTNGFFRRWQVIPFTETIPKAEQDTDLARQIIADELSGVFNWALDGLRRLLENKKFTICKAVEDQNHVFRRETDSVAMFIDEYGYIPNINNEIPLKEMFDKYRVYCQDCGYRPVGRTKFGERLRNAGFDVEKKNNGRIVYADCGSGAPF